MAAVAATAAQSTASLAALRRCLANGTNPSGAELRTMLDVIETAANTTDVKAVAACATWAAAQVTAWAAWVAVGVGDSSAVRTTQIALMDTAKVAAVAAAAATAALAYTQNDALDGRP